MRSVYSVFKKEVLSFFVTPLGYILFTTFFLLSGYFFFNLLGSFNFKLAKFLEMPVQMASRRPNLNSWVIEPYFQSVIFLWIFFAPFLTMKSFAEEKGNRSIVLLFTSPLSNIEMLLGKFLAIAFFVFAFTSVISIFPLLLCLYGNPEILLIFSGILSVLLTGLSFVSCGLLFSSMVSNQTISGVLTFVFILLFYFLHSFADAFTGHVNEVILYLSPVIQATKLTGGVLFLSSVVYFLSIIFLALILCGMSISLQRTR